MRLFEAPHHVFDRGSTKEVLLFDDISLHLLRWIRILVKQDTCNTLSSLPRLDQVDVVIIGLAVILFVLRLE